MNHDEFEKKVMEMLLVGEEEVFVKLREQYRVALSKIQVASLEEMIQVTASLLIGLAQCGYSPID